MPDYTVSIGGSTTLMIRDTGSWVEFWIKTGPYTWNYQQPWGGRINNSETGVRYFRMLQGGQWQFIDSWLVTYDQDVRFTILDSGLGFPSYDFWQHISRTSVPQPPYIHTADAISASHIHVEFDDGPDGGSPIVERQLGYGTDPYTAQNYWNAPAADENVGPFDPGTKVYFWARTRNAVGWSGWSNRGEARTWKTPNAPKPVTFSEITQTSIRTKFLDNGSGGSAIIERQLGYGLDPDTPENFAGDISGVNVLTGLVAGERYYFWARNRNSIGWSPWSARTQADLVAGARILVGTEWKRAVPYVKVDGVWKVAKPWVKSAGVWKETS